MFEGHHPTKLKQMNLDTHWALIQNFKGAGRGKGQWVRWNPATLEELKKLKYLNYVLEGISSSFPCAFICLGSS